MTEYITVTAAATIKNVSTQTIRQAVRRQDFPAIKVGKVHVIKNSNAFKHWQPDRIRQENGKKRRKKVV